MWCWRLDWRLRVQDKYINPYKFFRFWVGGRVLTWGCLGTMCHGALWAITLPPNPNTYTQTQSGSQGLLLTLCLGITSGRTREITCGARYQIGVGCAHGKMPYLLYYFCWPLLSAFFHNLLNEVAILDLLCAFVFIFSWTRRPGFNHFQSFWLPCLIFWCLSMNVTQNSVLVWPELTSLFIKRHVKWPDLHT